MRAMNALTWRENVERRAYRTGPCPAPRYAATSRARRSRSVPPPKPRRGPRVAENGASRVGSRPATSNVASWRRIDVDVHRSPLPVSMRKRARGRHPAHEPRTRSGARHAKRAAARPASRRDRCRRAGDDASRHGATGRAVPGARRRPGHGPARPRPPAATWARTRRRRRIGGGCAWCARRAARAPR